MYFGFTAFASRITPAGLEQPVGWPWAAPLPSHAGISVFYYYVLFQFRCFYNSSSDYICHNASHSQSTIACAIPQVLSGLLDGMTLGSPIAILVRNKDQQSKDYKEMQVAYRPSHAGAWRTPLVGVCDARTKRAEATKMRCLTSVGTL